MVLPDGDIAHDLSQEKTLKLRVYDDSQCSNHIIHNTCIELLTMQNFQQKGDQMKLQALTEVNHRTNSTSRQTLGHQSAALGQKSKSKQKLMCQIVASTNLCTPELTIEIPQAIVIYIIYQSILLLPHTLRYEQSSSFPISFLSQVIVTYPSLPLDSISFLRACQRTQVMHFVCSFSSRSSAMHINSLSSE